MLVIYVYNLPRRVVEVLEYYADGRVWVQTELGPMRSFYDELYVL